MAHKEDGNEHFKKKQYKDAIKSYSEGLAQGCEDSKLNAVLLGNRATSHYYLSESLSVVSVQ